ncbi:hypothetical protein [Limimaricola cinnabarinus]|jgi:hypothetical protein|uniref:hypothetical protein n=1 Tax=Limimaricola cinnabarinus TaxID=1125964 RepID=UPI001C1F59DB|nr:hypothetical protein [Limimaricola cinnabarinus]
MDMITRSVTIPAAPEQFIRVFDVGTDNTLLGGDMAHRVSPGCCDGMAVDEDGMIMPRNACDRSPTGPETP